MSATHTPGPWGVEQTADWLWIGNMKSSGKVNAIAARVDWDETYTAAHRNEIQANARLIATAPDLLEAAEKALDYLTDQHPAQEAKPEAALRAAIAKAKGQA